MSIETVVLWGGSPMRPFYTTWYGTPDANDNKQKAGAPDNDGRPVVIYYLSPAQVMLFSDIMVENRAARELRISTGSPVNEDGSNNVPDGMILRSQFEGRVRNI